MPFLINSVEGLAKFPISIIQSKNSTATCEYLSNHHGMTMQFLSNFKTKTVGSVHSQRLEFTIN